MAIEETNLEYDPTGNKYTQQYLKDNAIAPDDTAVSRLSSVYPAPKPYTPQQQEQTRNAASMAETLKSLAEIYGQSKGAYLRQRQPEESTKAENQILYNKNKYDQDLREYGRAMVGAMGQDSDNVRRLRSDAQRFGQTMENRDLALDKEKRQRENKLADDETNRKFRAAETDKRIAATKSAASIRATTPSKSGASSSVQVTDSNGNISTLPYKDWNIKSQSIYSSMVANGMPILKTTRKDPSDITGMRVIEVEDKSPANIRAYVERNINSKYMTPELWKEIYALSGKKAYTPTPVQQEQEVPKQETPKQNKQNVVVVPTKKIPGF